MPENALAPSEYSIGWITITRVIVSRPTRHDCTAFSSRGAAHTLIAIWVPKPLRLAASVCIGTQDIAARPSELGLPSVPAFHNGFREHPALSYRETVFTLWPLTEWKPLEYKFAFIVQNWYLKLQFQVRYSTGLLSKRCGSQVDPAAFARYSTVSSLRDLRKHKLDSTSRT
jgi:hypothetical protein